MKDKEKQIEEMAKVIDDRLIEARGYLGSMNRGEGYWIAQKLVEHYQPKLPKDSVVLSREEYEILTKDIEHPTDEVLKKLVVGKNILTEQVIEKTSKETAEKIILPEIETIKTIRDNCILPEPKYREGYVDCCNTILFYLKNNLAKQFGVEIKE